MLKHINYTDYIVSAMASIILIALVVSFAVAFAADNPTVNWSSEDDSLPEMLPKKMRGQSDEEIQKALARSYETLLKVVAEYSTHLLDPQVPYGYFKDEMPFPNTRSFNADSDLAFINNNIRGLSTYDKNAIVIQWVKDQVLTEVVWKETNIRGRYQFINSTYYNQGKYHIQVQDLKYVANTPLAENTAKCPSTVPKSNTSVSHKSIKATFTGGLPDVAKTEDNSHIKYYLETVAFQEIADRVARDTRNNITVAIRQAVKPYITFKNDTSSDIPGFGGKLPSGAAYTVSNTVAAGFANAEHKVKKVTVKMATNTATVEVRTTVHGLNGKFDVKLEETKPSYTGAATFTVSRVDINTAFNVLKPTECKIDFVANQIAVKSAASKLSADAEKFVANAFGENIKNHLSTLFCKTISQAIKVTK
ncbi:uncharacterized protein LOC126841773 isoform X2 [Adelges cooleyi]|uniref:uncharacterized protein LOC126841773 isoform X2 n=1 Tax=Adelges cooleyi TaxID=133065 RepID=UPI002180074F|nr:uncharacterized protein LOC126841773 isoform X2 [Adelges cooleyi]